LIWRYVDSYLKGATPDAFDLLFWDSDSVSLPGPMYCWYTRNTYLENNIKEPGKTTQCGVPVDLSKIDVPIYILASREDQIVPCALHATNRAARRDEKIMPQPQRLAQRSSARPQSRAFCS
jgi:poly(3-hydroxyalkanoate) synthetase